MNILREIPCRHFCFTDERVIEFLTRVREYGNVSFITGDNALWEDLLVISFDSSLSAVVSCTWRRLCEMAQTSGILRRDGRYYDLKIEDEQEIEKSGGLRWKRIGWDVNGVVANMGTRYGKEIVLALMRELKIV